MPPPNPPPPRPSSQLQFFDATLPLLPSFSGQQYATVLWAAARMYLRLPAPWLRALMRCSYPKLAALPSCELGSLAFALAHYAQTQAPPQQYMRRFALAVQARMPHIQVRVAR